MLFDTIDIPLLKAGSPEEPDIYLKYALRCITSSMWYDTAIEKIISTQENFRQMAKIIEVV